VSPAGTQIAFFRCLAGNCRVTIADRSGKTLAESQWYSDWWGLAWAPGGKEVWFSAVPGKSGEQCSVYAIDVTGRERLLFRAPGSLTLHDVSAEGRILASFDQVTNRLEMRDSPTAPPRDLSWKEGGTLADVSPDGVVLFYETGDSGGPDGLVYVRRPADPEPLPIGPGVPIAISDDGQTVLARTSRLPYKLSLVPTSGLPQALDVGDAIDASGGGWLKDGRLVVQLVRKAGEHPVVYARPREGGPLTQLLSDGVGVPPVRPVAPDGRRLVAFDVSRGPVMCEAAATGLATCKPLTAVTKDSIRPDERFGGWTADGGGVIVYRAYPTPVSIDRLDLATGRRERVAMLQPALPALTGIRQLLVTPKGAIFYDYSRNRSVLYVISGVK
jgi:hypothetical protein